MEGNIMQRFLGVMALSLTIASAGCASGAAPATSLPALPGATSAPSGGAHAPVIDGCQVFPTNNPWNTDISKYPVDPNSANYLSHMNAGTTFLHPDFGTDPDYGIPYVVVGASQPFVPMKFFLYPGQSDKGPYPYPPNAPIEGGKNSDGDRHVSVVDSGNCHLYETYLSYYVGPGWRAGNGAVFNFSTNKLRPDGWTSADAAGLPIFAGLVRYDEVSAGAIMHALRFTVHETQEGYIHPATHWASSTTDPGYPPMGLRVRLKASYDISGYTGEAHVILVAMQHYGMFVADNGSDWFFTGAPDPRWNDANLNTLKDVPASAFEVVQTGTIQH
jgi:hypothetical protein